MKVFKLPGDEKIFGGEDTISKLFSKKYKEEKDGAAAGKILRSGGKAQPQPD